MRQVCWVDQCYVCVVASGAYGFDQVVSAVGQPSDVDLGL